MTNQDNPNIQYTRAQHVFKDSPEDMKKLIKTILEEERKVMHKQRRPNIHQNIYDHVKRIVR